LDRLLEPLIQDGPKPEGGFRRASWDDALDVIAGRLRQAIAAHGGETVLPYFYLGAMGSSTRTAAGPRAWPMSTCGRCQAPMPRSRSG